VSGEHEKTRRLKILHLNFPPYSSWKIHSPE
jgi:hypothetical protein